MSSVSNHELPIQRINLHIPSTPESAHVATMPHNISVSAFSESKGWKQHSTRLANYYALYKTYQSVKRRLDYHMHGQYCGDQMTLFACFKPFMGSACRETQRGGMENLRRISKVY